MIPESFANKGWTLLEPFGGDASARHYSRLIKDGRTAILMDSSREKETIPDFMRIGAWLHDAGVKSPQIYDADEKNGFLLLEDFGDVSFKKAITSGSDKLLYYVLATDVLKHINEQKNMPKLPDYASSNLNKGHRRVIDWYLPTAKKSKNADGIDAGYLNAWNEIEKSLPKCPQTFVHADYHLENLMVLQEGEGLAHCGVLDFQDALIGPAPYDLANLLEDARTDVPEEIRTAMLAYYTADLKSPEEVEAFEAWYRVLATQFHCRVIGQFIKLALVSNKRQYLVFIPRLENYIKTALKDPLLAPLKAFFADIKLDFSAANGLNAALSTDKIRSDAF